MRNRALSLHPSFKALSLCDWVWLGFGFVCLFFECSLEHGTHAAAPGFWAHLL